jgi:hypothetical protein
MPLARWNRVPAAGMRPAESAVEPDGTASRSMTMGSTPASFAVSAAHSPAAPPPTISSGTRVSTSASAVTTTLIGGYDAPSSASTAATVAIFATGRRPSIACR